MTREEHMAWCKQRAHEYLKTGDLQNAVASMISDLSKHPETEGAGKSMAPIGLFAVMSGDDHEVRKFIDGFR